MLLNSIDQPIFVHDKEFKVVYANEAYIRVSNKLVDTIIGQVYWKSFPIRNKPLDGCLKALESKKSESEVIEVETGVFFNSRSFPISRLDIYQYSVHIFQDVTEQMKTYKRLNQEKDTLSTLIHEAADAIFLHDEKGCFIKVNQQACKSLGLSEDELLKLQVFDVEKILTKKELKRVWHSLRLGEHIILSGQHHKKNNGLFPVEVHISLINLKGKPLFLAIVRDVSEQKKIESALKRQLLLSELNKKVAVELSDLKHLEKNLHHVVQYLGEALEVDRCYLFDYEAEDGLLSNTYEWCSKGTKSFIKSLQKIPFSKKYPWLSKKIKQFEMVKVASLNDLPKAATTFKKELEKESIQSILVLPLLHEERLLGMIGFDAVNLAINWSEIDIYTLMTASRLIGNAYIQRENIKLERLNKNKLEEMFFKLIESTTKMLEQRDPYTAGHQLRVAALAKEIAKTMQLSEQQVQGVYLGALIHDIGKIKVPAEILASPRALTLFEFGLIKEHPQSGFEIVQEVPFVWPIKEIILQHHERLDGSGYPHGLKNDEISLEARIVAVADTCEAMSSHRPYRPAKPLDMALNELKRHMGILYDKEAVKACLKVFNEQKFQFPIPSSKTPFFDKEG